MRAKLFAIAGSLLLSTNFQAAHATVSSTVREATASIPCAGKLVEHRYEGGDIASFMSGVTLVCEGGPHHAHWMLEAAVSCNARRADASEDEHTMEKVCAGRINEPLDKFLPNSSSDVHNYSLTKYIFATNCDEITYRYKNMEAVTNKVTWTTTNSGWACKDISHVTGTGELAAGPVGGGSTSFRFVPVTVSGGGEQDTNGEEAGLLPILGVDEYAATYSVHLDANNKPEAN